MKNGIRMLGAIAIAAVMMASFIACKPPSLKGTVTIDGDPVFMLGKTLTANTASLDGSGTISYQWMRGGAAINGEDKSTYTLQAADKDAVITVTVTRAGNAGSVASAPVTIRVSSLTGTVSIDGDPMMGKTLKANTASLGGSGTISYQWMRGGEAINGEDKSEYTLTNTDMNSAVTVTVICSDNAGSVTSAPVNVAGYSVGMTGPGGGKIFYHSEKGFTMTDTGKICHYLEAAPVDYRELAWASSGFTETDIPGTTTAIGAGRKNTALILAVDPNAPAALACKKYSNNGLNDWFLPSQDELNQLFLKRSVVGINNDEYWSSSQDDIALFSCYQHFFMGQGSTWKYSKDSVRAIRAF